jgi:hypothetical protein
MFFSMHDDASPNAFTIVESPPNGDDWRKIKAKLVTDDPRVPPIVQPIIDQYAADIFQYHLDCEHDREEKENKS